MILVALSNKLRPSITAAATEYSRVITFYALTGADSDEHPVTAAGREKEWLSKSWTRNLKYFG